MPRQRSSRRKGLIWVRPTEELLEDDRKVEVKIKEENESEYTCAMCGEIFYKQSILAAHVRISHAIETDFFCEDCNENFLSREEKDEHRCKENTPFPLVKCEYCAKYYHISEEDEHKCNQGEEQELFSFSTDLLTGSGCVMTSIAYLAESDCRNSFTNSSTFVPVKKKRGRKPKLKEEVDNFIKSEDFEGLECEKCGKILRSHASLALHKRTHSEIPSHVCEYCDKKFTLSEYYNRHIRVHTKQKPYKCDLCEKSFSQPNTLMIHKRIHTGEKPYTCIVCRKTFRVQDYLTKHMRSHTGEKPYQCSLCDKRFSQKSGYNFHHRTVHLKQRNIPQTGIIKQES